jgi:5-(carboxyamino)imidazole ribonucleotide synthase
MVNLVGGGPDPAAVLAVPGTHLHLYGKAARPGRKLGHVTARADDPAGARVALERLLALVGPEER